MQNKTSNTSQQAAKRSGRGGHCELRGRRLFLSADRPPLDRASVMRHSLANRNKVFAFGRRLVRGLEITGVVAAAIVVIPILLPIYTIACGREFRALTKVVPVYVGAKIVASGIYSQTSVFSVFRIGVSIAEGCDESCWSILCADGLADCCGLRNSPVRGCSGVARSADRCATARCAAYYVATRAREKTYRPLRYPACRGARKRNFHAQRQGGRLTLFSYRISGHAE